MKQKLGATSRKKKCRKERNFDCVDEEKLQEQENMILKISYQKCKEEKKKNGEKRRGPLTTIKYVPFSEMVMNMIQPSMEAREKFLMGRHVDCILGKVRTVDLTAIREELKRPRLPRRVCTEPIDQKRKRKKKKKKETEEEKEVPKTKNLIGQQEEDISGERNESADVSDRKDSDKSDERAESGGTIESEDPANESMDPVVESMDPAVESMDPAVESMDPAVESVDPADEPKISSASREASESKDASAKPEDSPAPRKVRKRDHPDKFWCEKVKRSVKEVPSYISEKQLGRCESVCSFDSDVCLAGLALTMEDKKTIAKNRERVRGSSKNNEAKNDTKKE